VFTPAAVAVGALLIGFVGQAMKICVDTTLQECVDDGHRGRVFSVYDTLFNVAFVVSLLVGAVVLPESGVSRPVVAAVGLLYLVAALAYAVRSHRGGRSGTRGDDFPAPLGSSLA
jgi:MFS family permease